MSYNNFLISGFGRSGTKFLSNVMNKSKTWTVKHEPRGMLSEKSYKNNKKIPQKVIKDFNKNYYGEVNSYLRFYFDELKVKKKGIIIRDPEEIILSVCNRPHNLNNNQKVLNIIDELNYFWHKFKKYTNNDNIKTIIFHKMTTDKDYLSDILKHFEINDINIDEIDINKKINKNNVVNYNSWEELPKLYINKYNTLKW